MSFDLNALMKQAQEMQEQMSQMQEEASKETAEASAGGGMVTVVASAAGEDGARAWYRPPRPAVHACEARCQNLVRRVGRVDAIPPRPLASFHRPARVAARRVRAARAAPVGRCGPDVDASDVLPDGSKFKNIDEYKQLLLRDKDQLARALTEKLLIYAMGGALELADKPEIEGIVRKVRDKNYGFRSLVHEIVQSKAFQTK